VTEHDDKYPVAPGEARGYSWPPAEPGNFLALKHGAKSPRIVDPLAAEIVAEAVADAPYLDQPKYRATVMAWAREEARCRLLSDYIERVGLVDDQGNVARAEGALHRAETRAANLRTACGLTPMSRARLGRDVAQAQVSLTQQLADRQRQRDEAGGDDA
jgi:hypothetical protein